MFKFQWRIVKCVTITTHQVVIFKLSTQDIKNLLLDALLQDGQSGGHAANGNNFLIKISLIRPILLLRAHCLLVLQL